MKNRKEPTVTIDRLWLHQASITVRLKNSLLVKSCQFVKSVENVLLQMSTYADPACLLTLYAPSLTPTLYADVLCGRPYIN